jgi:hypothetical protein
MHTRLAQVHACASFLLGELHGTVKTTLPDGEVREMQWDMGIASATTHLCLADTTPAAAAAASSTATTATATAGLAASVVPGSLDPAVSGTAFASDSNPTPTETPASYVSVSGGTL